MKLPIRHSLFKQFLLLAFIIPPSIVLGQTIKESTYDEETHTTNQVTSWEPLLKGLTSEMVAHIQCTKANADIDLGFKLLMVRGAVDEGAALQLYLDNDTVVTLHNTRFTLPCMGCGAVGFFGSGSLGFYLHYYMPPVVVPQLTAHKIKKLRIYMHDGYHEENVKAKFSDILQKELRLFR